MDEQRTAGDPPPIPSRRSISGGKGHRLPIPHPRQSPSNSGGGTPARDEESPPPCPEKRKTPTQTPPPLKSTSSHDPRKTQMCVPTHWLAMYKQFSSQQESNQRDSILRVASQSGHSQRNICQRDAKQETYYAALGLSKDPQDRGGRRPSGQRMPIQRLPSDRQYYQHVAIDQQGFEDEGDCEEEQPADNYLRQRTSTQMTKQRTATTPPRTRAEPKDQVCKPRSAPNASGGKPEWKIVLRRECKPFNPASYPLPPPALPPVSRPVSPLRQHASESQSTSMQLSTKKSELNNKNSQIIAHPNQMSKQPSQVSGQQSCVSGPGSQNRNLQSHISGQSIQIKSQHTSVSGQASQISNVQNHASKRVNQNSSQTCFVSDQSNQVSVKQRHVSKQASQNSAEPPHFSDQCKQVSGKPSHDSKQASQNSAELPHASDQSNQVSVKQRHVSKQASQNSAELSHVSDQSNQVSGKQSHTSKRDSQNSAQPCYASDPTSQSKVQENDASKQPSQSSSKHSQLSGKLESQSKRQVSCPEDTPEQQSLRKSKDATILSSSLLPEITSNSRRSSRARHRELSGAPIRRSSERVNMECAAVDVPCKTSISTKSLHFSDDNIDRSARCSSERVRVKPSMEKLQAECANILKKLSAGISVGGDAPSRLCMRVSVGEMLTTDGRRKSFTICQPDNVSLPGPDQCEATDDNLEQYATPSAPSPQKSAQDVAEKSTSLVTNTNEFVKCECIRSENDEPDKQPDREPDKELEEPEKEPDKEPDKEPEKEPEEEPEKEQEKEPEKELEKEPDKEPPIDLRVSPTSECYPSSIQESQPREEDITPTSNIPGATPNKPGAVDQQGSSEPVKEYGHLDRESTTGIKMKTAENEALNTEFLYYSSALKNLLPELSCPANRGRLVPWVKKLFSPEYCARLLRDKRNRFLLHLALVLCNDEVIGVFKNPPPEGTIPSVDELCTTRYPPACWECDRAWLDHLEDVPPGVARMPCSWHPSGCPAPTDSPAAAESNGQPRCPEICHPWLQYGTDNETSIGWSLDQEFKLLLYLSRPLKPLMKVSRDRQRMVSWLRFLCTATPECCVALRMLRNDYAKLLLAYVQDDRMTGPFANDPIWGQPLPPLGDEGDGDQAKPFADPTSADVDEFLRTVPVPNEGAFCYVAVDGVPITPITRPSASASLLQR